MFKAQTIVSILRGLSNFNLLLGVLAVLLSILYCFANAGTGILMVIGSIIITVTGSIGYSAMAIIIEAIDSIARTNKKIAEILDKQNNSSPRTADGYDKSLPPM